MTRTQAWRTVAKAFGTSLEQRTEAQERITSCGLFLAMSLLGHSVTRIIPEDWPLPNADDGERALFAGLLAAMSQKERDLLEPGL